MTLIKLDFDNDLPDDLTYRIVWTLEVLGVRVDTVRVDRTRRGWHVVIAVRRRLSAITVVALQAMLGSDPKREAFNLVRVRNIRNTSPFWRARWNVLYARHNKGSEALP